MIGRTELLERQGLLEQAASFRCEESIGLRRLQSFRLPCVAGIVGDDQNLLRRKQPPVLFSNLGRLRRRPHFGFEGVQDRPRNVGGSELQRSTCRLSYAGTGSGSVGNFLCQTNSKATATVVSPTTQPAHTPGAPKPHEKPRR